VSDWDVPKLRRLVVGFPPWRPGIETGSANVGFLADKVALGQASPAKLHSTNCSTITIINIWSGYNRPVVAAVSSGHSLIPLRIIQNKILLKTDWESLAPRIDFENGI
jgi:hypothetical protein